MSGDLLSPLINFNGVPTLANSLVYLTLSASAWVLYLDDREQGIKIDLLNEQTAKLRADTART
jgi:hypothetical protein